MHHPASGLFAGAERELVAGDMLANATCKDPIAQEDLQLGLKLGAQFLTNSQRDAGNFRYEYDWVSQKETDEDNPVRQAGTLWGLTLLHVDDPKAGLLPAIRKGFKYFQRHSVEFPGGLRLVDYPGQDPQKLGAVALLALAHIEVLRRPEALDSEVEKNLLESQLAGYLKAILAARTKKNNFYKFYQGKTGKAFGPSSPYYDGECLLALVKAAKYLGHEHLWPHIKVSAEAGWKKNVQKGLNVAEGKAKFAKEKESDDSHKRMKGYYQWGSMAWYELSGMPDPSYQKYASRLTRYGDWLTQKFPGPHVNMGFAFEGIIPAYVTAVRKGDAKLHQRLACLIRSGMETLHSLQVGHKKAYNLVPASADPALAKKKIAQGGAQASRDAPALRIDTTQHQLHALLMARRLLQQQALI